MSSSVDPLSCSGPSESSTSVPDSTPANIAPGPPAQASPQPEQQQAPPEHPAPGTFMYLPHNASWVWCSQQNPGSPGNHPVLLLPTCSGGYDPATHVDVLFATTKDVVGCCKSAQWGCYYVPVEGQKHPFRDAIPLAKGCTRFRSPTSINVWSVYTVARSELQDVSFGSPDSRPALQADGLTKVLKYVENPCADISKYRRRQPVDRPVVTSAVTSPSSPSAPVPATTTTTREPTTAPIADVAEVRAPPIKRRLSPEATVFIPYAPKRRDCHPAWTESNWRSRR